jgi:hypothetical protein
MADPQPQSNDQGFLPGLLGKVRDFFPDPAAAYGGLLSDEATRRAFAWRELGAAAGAFSQGAMPVPYKGGIPFGATLGAAGAAASTAGDELMKARLQAAQADLAQQQGLLAHANVQGLAMNNSLYPVALGMEKGVPGTGTGTDGKPLTGPAKIIAGGGGSAVGGIGGPENAEIRTNNFAGMRVPGAAAGGPNTNPAGWQTFATPADGVQAIGNQLDRYAAGKTTGQPLATLRQMVSTWAPPSENDTDALIKRASTVTGLDPDAPVDLSNPAVRAKVTEAFIRNEQGGNLHPKAVEGLSAVYGNAWSPHGGQAQTAAAPAPAAEPPMAPSAAPPGGLLKLPDPTSAAPPQLATPPAAGAPGPVTGLLGQQPAQQVAAADAPQLSPAAAAILQGINRQQAGGGLLASGSVAGGNAVPTGGPSPAAVAQAGPPHTGAAGAAELAGLLAQQPPPQAPAAGPVPPAAAPAPAPAPAGPMPPAPGGAPPPGVAPPMPPPAPPQMPPPPVSSGPIPGAPTDRQVAAASIIAHNNIMMGKAVPPDIAAILNYKYAGPTAAATAGSTSAAQLPYQQQQQAYQQQLQDYYKAQEQYRQYLIDVGKAGPIAGATKAVEQPYVLQQQGNKAMWDLFIQQNKPEAIRPGSILWNQQNQTGTANWEAQGADGAMHQFIGTIDPTGKILQQTQLGISKPSAATTAGQTGIAQKNADTYEQVQKEAAAANEARTQATFMRQEAPNFYTGVGAAYNQDFNRVLLALNPDNPDRANKVASYETFIKDAGILVRSQAQAASQRGAGVQELKLIGSQMPSEDTSQRGLDRVLAQIQGLSDYRLVKQTAQDQYVNQPGRGGWDNNGFEAQFNKNISPYTFMYMRMSDQDKQGIRDELSKTKAGQSEMQRLSDQIGYINQNGLRP